MVIGAVRAGMKTSSLAARMVSCTTADLGPEKKSYILGLAKYVRHGALDRVAYTCKQYKLPGTTHIDVLTYYAIRNDWDRQYPASGYTNLLEGKYKILDAFHKEGIDVSSEAPRYPFMGKVSFYRQGCGIRACPMGGRPIPMFPAIYRQVAVWGDGMRRGETNPGAQQMFYRRRTALYDAAAMKIV